MAFADLPDDLTASGAGNQIDTFRQVWIRDDFDSAPESALSEYNRRTSTQFFSDSALQQIYDTVRAVNTELLTALWWEVRGQRIEDSDWLEADAEAEADAVRMIAVYRLMRAFCRRQMVSDPGFRASITTLGKDQDKVFEIWENEIAGDYWWVRTKAGRFGIEVGRG